LSWGDWDKSQALLSGQPPLVRSFAREPQPYKFSCKNPIDIDSKPLKTISEFCEDLTHGVLRAKKEKEALERGYVLPPRKTLAKERGVARKTAKPTMQTMPNPSATPQLRKKFGRDPAVDKPLITNRDLFKVTTTA
jgi:hypothetical protein